MARAFSEKLAEKLKNNPNANVEKFDHLLEASNEIRNMSIHAYAKKVMPNLEIYHHTGMMLDAWEGVAKGSIHNLIIMTCPRMGKSTVSSLGASYFLHCHPTFSIIGASATDTLAENAISRKVQNYYVRGGGELLTKPLSMWHTATGGSYQAVGRGSMVTGFDAHLIYTDDLIKGSKETRSQRVMASIDEWLQSELFTRQTSWSADKQDVPIVMCGTLWGANDPIQKQIDLEMYIANDDSLLDLAKNWTILCLPAIQDNRKRVFPKTTTVIMDERKEGEALCPELRSAKKLNQRKLEYERTGQSHLWHSIYQQDPRPAEGTVIKPEWFEEVGMSEIPTIVDWFVGYDFAFSESETSDMTCGVMVGLDEFRNMYFKIVYLNRVDVFDLPEAIEDAVPRIGDMIGAKGNQGVHWAFEKVHAGVSVIKNVKEHGVIHNDWIFEVAPRGRTKLDRASGWISDAKRGKMRYIIEDRPGKEVLRAYDKRMFGKWKQLVAEFTNSEVDFDDPIDALSVAYEVVIKQYGSRETIGANPIPGEIFFGDSERKIEDYFH